MPEAEGRPVAPGRGHLGLWLIIQCSCGYRVDYPIRLLIKHYSPDADLHLSSARLRCTNCKGRLASVQLVDRPDRVSGGHGGGPSASIKPLP
jgi:hypothetical protein